MSIVKQKAFIRSMGAAIVRLALNSKPANHISEMNCKNIFQ